MTKTYGATNPEQIISLFQMRAKIAADASDREKRVRQSALYTREKHVWLDAADILANTEFVGWSTGQPVADISAIKNSNTPAAQEAARKIADGGSIAEAVEGFRTATAAGNVVISMEAASVILAALERPQAFESTRKYPFMRERHDAAIIAMREAIQRAG